MSNLLLPETPYYRDKWIMPPGKVAGVKPDTVAPGKVAGFYRQHQEVIPVEEWDEFLESDVDLTLNSKFIYDQDGIGACGAEGASGCTEIALGVEGMDQPLFNGFGPYHWVSGGRDQGSTLSDNVKFMRGEWNDRGKQIGGAFRAELFPRSKGFRERPSDEAIADAWNYRWDEVLVAENWEELGSGTFKRFVAFCSYMGHAWVGLRPVNKYQLKWRNSWDETWGDGGYGIINASRILFPCYLVRSTRIAA